MSQVRTYYIGRYDYECLLQAVLLGYRPTFSFTDVIFMVCMCQYGIGSTTIGQTVRWVEQLMLVNLEGPLLKSFRHFFSACLSGFENKQKKPTYLCQISETIQESSQD